MSVHCGGGWPLWNFFVVNIQRGLQVSPPAIHSMNITSINCNVVLQFRPIRSIMFVNFGDFPLCQRKIQNESGYFKSGPTTGFWRFFLFLHGMSMYACSLFWKHDTSTGSWKIIIFPLAFPLGNIWSPEWGQIPKLFIILKNWGILRKSSNARRKMTKMSGMNPLMLL